MKYKVWMEIEGCDDDLGIYELASPFAVCCGEFDTIEEADDLIVAMTGESSLNPSGTNRDQSLKSSLPANKTN